MIYTSEHYSTAMLEKLVRGSGSLPPNQHYIEVMIPGGVSYEQLNEAQLPDWAEAGAVASKLFGEKWHHERRSLFIIVPSVVARIERNFLINPDHSEFPRVTYSLHRPIWWDSRLFGSGP